MCANNFVFAELGDQVLSEKGKAVSCLSSFIEPPTLTILPGFTGNRLNHVYKNSLDV